MSALYRQARPTTFDEMVGQEHVKEVLLSALRSGRLAQAYLFSGPRGVGKTSSARLIAQAVNCSGQPKPCGVCEGCRLVREGRHPDVLEIDAASNNSVEDVRDLRERILLAPIMGDKKVVILDEAHMMSKSAFNALLKTLEEPPAHVIFIFATTEPERMPPTILSRTQHFRFRRLSEAEIVQKLGRILQGLGRQAEDPALHLVARMADGAMRDAESLLDRLLTLEGTITLAQTEAALGLPPQEALFAVAEALDRGQVKQAIEQSQQLYTQGFAARTLAQGLLEAIRAGLYGKMGLGLGPHLNSPEDRLVAAMTALDEALERLLKRSDALALELAVLAAFQAMHTVHGASLNVAVTAPPPSPKPSSLPDFDPRPGRLPETRKTAPQAEEQSSPEKPEPSPQPPPLPQSPEVMDLAQEWRRVMNALKMNVRAFVREAEPRIEEGKVVLLFPEKASFHYQSAQKNLADIHKAIYEVLGKHEVELRLGGAKKKLAEADTPPTRPFPTLPKREPPRLQTAMPVPEAAPPPGQAEPPAEALKPEPAEIHTPIPFEALGVEALKSSPPVPEPLAPEPQPEPLPPEETPWFPPESPFHDEAPPEEALPEGAEARPPDTANLLEDPRFQRLVKLFGGRLRKFHKDTPRETEAEAPPEAELGEE